MIFIKKQDIESDLEENASDLFYIIKDNKNEEKIEKKQVEKNHDRYRHEYFPSGESSDSLSLQEKYSDSNIEINSKISFVGECEDQTKIVIKQLEERNEIEVREFGSKEKEKHVGNLKKMPCPFCNKMLARIDEHIRLLHRNRVYKCTKHGCEAEFLTLKNLQSHQLNCFDITKAYKCSRCLKEFHRKSNYKAHVRRHANKKDFQCQLCDRAFVDSTGLRRHFLKHHEPEQEIFVSGCCGKRFKSKEGLKKHIRRSTCGIQIFQVVESNWRTNEVCTPKITQELSFERNC